ncbi:MAG TPA: hypothetical protein VF510_08355, partial [Ktedonobacterales bacterium]
MATRLQGRRTSFRRVFVWYCAGIVGATVGISCIIELLLLIWYIGAKRTAPVASEPLLAVQTRWMAFSVPFVVLLVA